MALPSVVSLLSRQQVKRAEFKALYYELIFPDGGILVRTLPILPGCVFHPVANIMHHHDNRKRREETGSESCKRDIPPCCTVVDNPPERQSVLNNFLPSK